MKLKASIVDLKDILVNNRFSSNLLSNTLLFILNFFIGILITPFYIRTLGIAAYGVIPLANSITSYLSLVTVPLSSSLPRFLATDLHKNDSRLLNRTFNTGLITGLSIVILLVPVCVFISIFAPAAFNIPLDLRNSAIVVFFAVSLSFLIISLASYFYSTLFANNRLDLINIIQASNIVVQTSLIVLFFYYFYPFLGYIGIGYLSGAFIALITAIVFWKKFTPQFKFSPSLFSSAKLKELSGMGIWIMFDQIGTLLFLQVDLIAVNKLFGLAAGGEYSLVLLWGNLMKSIAGTLSLSLTPIILTLYARKKFKEMGEFTEISVKILGLIMALPIGFICGFSSQILSLWVGPSFVNLSPLIWITVAPLVVNLSVLPLFPVNVAFNNVRKPGLTTFFLGLANFVLAFLIPLVTGWGIYGVAIAGVFVLTLRNIIFTPWFASSVLNIKIFEYYKSLIPGILCMAAIALVGYGICLFMNIDSWLRLIFCASVISMLYLSIFWRILLTRDEKKIFYELSYLEKFKA
jgi:O-antigen/teichoic acid export membrane protein